MPVRAPAVFISHGSPMTALDSGSYFRALRAFGERHPARAAIVVSGHWEEGPPVRVASSPHPPMIYDFYGFPQELYQVGYPAPGDPELALEIAGLLAASGVDASLDPRRGFDHGVWTPLRMLFPSANVPVIPLSLPVERSPRSLHALGSILAPLRERGIWILGSGGIVHNLSLPRPAAPDAPAEAWAAEFDGWIKRAIETRDIEALFAYRTAAPYARQAAPTTDHFDPLFVILGAAGAGPAEWIYEGFQYAHMSLRCLAL